MDIKLKKSEVLSYLRLLRNIKGYDNFQFKYAVRRNIDKLEPIIKPIEAMELENLQIIQDFTIERLELCKKHCTKMANGDPVMVDGEMGPGTSYDIPADVRSIFDNELKELKEKHKEALDSFEAKNKEVKEVMEGEEAISTYEIKKVHVPATISDVDFDAIYPFLEQD